MGYARVDVPGRIFALEANRRGGSVWLVGISDFAGEAVGAVANEIADGRTVTVHADSAGEAVWRVARAAVRAVAEMTGGVAETTTENGPED